MLLLLCTFLILVGRIFTQDIPNNYQTERAGLPCRKDEQCGPGYYCHHVFLFQKFCQPMQPIGGQCRNNRACVTNNCDKKTKTCIGGTLGFNETCVMSSDCKQGLYCTSILRDISPEVKNVTSYKCIYRLNGTEVCFAQDECNAGLFCAQGLCSSSDEFIQTQVDWVIATMIISAGVLGLFIIWLVLYITGQFNIFNSFKWRYSSLPYSSFQKSATR
jgi:hypothetical protein